MKKNRFMLFFCVLPLFCFAFFICRSGPLAVAHAENPDSVMINWAFGALVKADGEDKLIAVEKDTILKSGDRIKMMIEPKSPSFVYLIYQSSDSDIQLLFPGDLNRDNQTRYLFKKHFIPKSDLWFTLDQQTGIEKFHLLASKNRLTELESLLKEHQGSSADRRAALALQITSHIKEIRRRHKRFAAQAERPVSIGGSFRGLSKHSSSLYDITTLAVQLSAADFYGRTFTIDHK